MMTFPELIEAYRRGEKLTPLMIDNDSVTVTRVDEENDPDWLNAEDVFEMHPEELLTEALNLLSLPNEHV